MESLSLNFENVHLIKTGFVVQGHIYLNSIFKYYLDHLYFIY